MRRHPWILYTLLFLLLAGAAGVVWLTYHPESPVFDRLVRWPGVGPWAERLREAYRPQEPPADLEEDAEAGTPESPRKIILVGSPDRNRKAMEARWEALQEELTDAQIERIRAREFRWFRPGAALHEAPDSTSPVRRALEVPQRFSFLERRDGWARVRVGGEDAWIPVTEDTVMIEPPLGREAAPVLPVPGQEADPRLLEVARRALAPERQTTVGPYPLWTDVEDGPLLRQLERVARTLEDAYEERYGLEPQYPPTATVILFRRETQYRAFQGEEARLTGLNPRGHTGKGIVALYRGPQPLDEVASTLAHELVHLVNRRALGPALPPWLNEGMAEDLSLSYQSDAGRFDPSKISGGLERTTATDYQLRLGHASLERLRRILEDAELPSVEALVTMDWKTFVSPGDEEVHYAQSAFFVRWLLEDASRADRFRAFLRDVAQGALLTPESFREALGVEWTALDAGFQAFLKGQFQRFLSPGDTLPQPR